MPISKEEMVDLRLRGQKAVEEKIIDLKFYVEHFGGPIDWRVHASGALEDIAQLCEFKKQHFSTETIDGGE